jgi:hypothetical protein
MTHDEQRTVEDTDTQTHKHTAEKYRTVFKNQHSAEKWAQAEKRSVDFVGYS